MFKQRSKHDINYDFELTASILAYEIARSDGNVTESELFHMRR